MAAPEQEIIGDVLVGDVKWRVTLSHSFICLWTDDADSAPRYVFSATIPPEALQLAVEAARRHAANSPMLRPKQVAGSEKHSDLAKAVNAALQESDMD
jgi:hypothetical protein